MANLSKQLFLKDGRIQLATQKGDVITFEHFPGRVTSLTAVRQNGVTAELTFNQVEGATHMLSKDKRKTNLAKPLQAENL